MRVSFNVNDDRFGIEVPAERPLVDIVRGEFGIRSVHAGCRMGNCGSCMVIMNDHVVPSCLIPAFSLRDQRIETIEGVSARMEFQDIEKGFLKSGFNPCGFCAPSKALLAEALLRHEHDLNPELILSSIPEQWCSCTTPEAFVDAVKTCYDLRRRRVRNG